mgnify:CR=1 FL=1
MVLNKKIPVVMPSGQTIYVSPGRNLLEQIPNLKKVDAIVARVYEKSDEGVRRAYLIDLNREISEKAHKINILTFDHPDGKIVYWHTSAHIMAQAVKELFPDAMLGTGPPYEFEKRGRFFYDFYFKDRSLSSEDLTLIEDTMRDIIKKDIPIVRRELPREEAMNLFKERNELFKVELLREDTKDPIVSIYVQGDFIDLCTGPHLPSTGWIGVIKLLNISSAYWKGDAQRETMQRIEGVSFPTQDLLEEYFRKLAEAKRRDHRMLGPQLGLFEIHGEDIGSGLIIWYPNGAVLRKTLESFLIKFHILKGYQILISPHIAEGKLFARSGHLRYYYDLMYHFDFEKNAILAVQGKCNICGKVLTEHDPGFTCLNCGYTVCLEHSKELLEHKRCPKCNSKIEITVVKPMNCPFHILVYKSRRRSYKELPIRYFELGTVYRHELEGVLHGTLRARGFTQDDAHVFARPDQVEDEIIGVLKLMEELYEYFGITEFYPTLSLHDPNHTEKFMGSKEEWEFAENVLRNALDTLGWDYREEIGEAAFYGPKIDVKIRDSLGRDWQCTTVQLSLIHI